jgi:cytosine/uracil/thiamine/allantoin permease
MGLPVKRWQATVMNMVLYDPGGDCYPPAPISARCGQFLSLLIIFLAHWCAIYLTDAWLRRDSYDSAGLLVRLGGPYWYQGGFNPAGLLAMIGGMIASALWLNSPLLQGPFSRLFGGSDMSIFTGFIVGGVLYWIFVRVLIPRVVPLTGQMMLSLQNKT